MPVKSHHQLIHGINACPSTTQPIHLGIGIFDGVHLGHQSIINSVQSATEITDGLSSVLTFWPHPSAILKPQSPTPQIFALEKKLHTLSETGLDWIILQTFDRDFSNLTAQDFLTHLQTALPTLKSIHIGEDFHFGQERTGNIELLKNNLQHVKIEVCKQKIINHAVVSSTAIRNLLKDGQIEQAIQQLTRPYTYEGTVIHGDQRGRTLGFPTLNIVWNDTLCPKHGVYAVKVKKLPTNSNWEMGVANLGLRPTIGDLQHPLLEIHILTPTDLTYHDHLLVDFKHFIRPEGKFKSLDDLTQSIKKDVEKAKNYFKIKK